MSPIRWQCGQNRPEGAERCHLYQNDWRCRGSPASSYLLSVRRISGISEIGLQIVRVPSQSGGQAGAVVIDLAEISVKRPVLLHHENDVVHALERPGGSWGRRGGRSRCWAAGAKALTTGEQGDGKQSKKTDKCNFFHVDPNGLTAVSVGPLLLLLGWYEQRLWFTV
jgi:hypothetical protein